MFSEELWELSESQEKLNQEGLVRSLFLFRYMWNDQRLPSEKSPRKVTDLPGESLPGEGSRQGLRPGARTEWRQRGIWVPTSGADGGLTLRGKEPLQEGCQRAAAPGLPACPSPALAGKLVFLLLCLLW